MRVLVAIVAVVMVPGHARADEPLGVEESAEASERPPDAPPALRFDPTLKIDLERMDERTATIWRTPDADLHLTGAWRLGDPDPGARENDQIRQWRAGLGAGYDLGWARVSVSADYEHFENELGRGRNVEAGVGLTRTFRVSRTMSGFISLTLGHRRWLGQPLPGEFDATTVMLRIGVRWK